MHLNFSSVLSVVSLVVSVTVAWLTLFRRGTLRMTQPVQVAFLFEGQPLRRNAHLRILMNPCDIKMNWIRSTMHVTVWNTRTAS